MREPESEDARRKRMALEAYAYGDVPVPEIARAYGISAQRLRIWAREAGIARKGR